MREERKRKDGKKENLTMNGGEEGVAEVVVEILVLAHGVHLFPLHLSHLLPQVLWVHVIHTQIKGSLL